MLKAPALERKDAEASGSKEAFLGMGAIVQEKRTLLGKSPVQPLYWNPLLVADEQGRAVIELPRLERPAAIRVILDAHAAGRLGALDATLEVNPAGSSGPTDR